MTPVNPGILNAISAGISSEIASYVFYMEASKMPQTAEIKSILEGLALEEKKHFQILERQHHSLIKSEHWISISDILKSDKLPEIKEEMTASHRELVNEVQSAQSIREILDIAYRLEEDAHNMFLSEAARTDSPEARDIFSRLAGFEQGHMTRIGELRQKYA